ncbi:MAG TPA: M56 family metallopeptidase [Candidatus Bathyarchaeia archaeon]|nr:M56 family metallopeptidase [Candidatus Bathyarchaeia archaeon]
MAAPVSYKITTEVPASYMEKLVDFIHKQYLLPQKQRFMNVSRETTESGTFLSYVVLGSQGKQLLQVEVKGTKPIELTLTPVNGPVSATVIEEAKQDVVIAVQIFEEKARKATLYFAWREGEDIVPEVVKKQEKSLNRLFLETQILFFIVFIVLGMLIFVVIAELYPDMFWIAPIILITVQFVFVFYSGSFIARTADWHITEANPIIHFLEYHLPIGAHDDFRQTYSADQLVAIKKEVYDEILAKRGEIDCESAQKVFAEHGIACQPENLSAKKVNVYELVKKIADRFGFPMPKIVVSNTMVPNAATSGPSPSRGVVLITTGLLVQLEEDEVISVLGHEFGHLKGRDPLILYGLTSAEFLLRFYVLFPLFPFIFSSFLFFVYFWAVMVVIFFIAKFFEARADLVSAIKMGQPEVLAGALEKIGFQRLLYERTPSFRIQEWIGLDPHPPIYFRVSRLEKLKVPVKIKHALIQSIKDVTSGFIESL